MSAETVVPLPRSWVGAELREIVEVNYGKALPERHRDATGSYPVVGSSGVVGKHSCAVAHGPCLVIGRKGAAGSVHYINRSCWPIDTAYFMQPPAEVDITFLRHFLASERLVQLEKSTAVPSLSRDDLYDVKVPLAPLPEQVRIGAKLEELFSDLEAAVAELEAAGRKLTQYRQSLLKAAVEGDLTAEWRASNPPQETGAELLARMLRERRARWEARQLERFAKQGKPPPKDARSGYTEPTPPETSQLHELPREWTYATLGQCFDVGVGATPSRKVPEYWNGHVPWVSSGEVRFNRIRATRESITQLGLENCSTQMNPIGSVLLGMIGEGRTRGQVAILDIEAANNQNCAAIWVSRTEIPPEFIYYWLWSRYDETRRGSSGNNQPALNKTLVEAMPTPVLPVLEAREIVERVAVQLAAIERQEREVEQLLKMAAAQRQNILRAAFSGQLVPQDPTDEPASVLLDRIRAERAQPLSSRPAQSSRRLRKTTC